MTTTDPTTRTRTRTTGSFTTRRTREANGITTALAVPCALAAVSSVIPAVEHATTAVLLALALAAVLVLGLRLGTRWLRERREDRADTLTGAHWRAEHAPHLLTADDRARINERTQPVRPARPVPVRGVA